LLDYELSLAQAGYVVRALLTLEGKAPSAARGRIPINVSIVLDRSGSMEGEKLAAARAAAAMLVRRLHPEDMVSVVTYDDEVQTIAEPANGTSQRGLARAIERVQSGGATNLSGGWLQGQQLVARHRSLESSNRVVLMTDGLANRGITDANTLVSMCQSARAGGVTTTTIGFGADYDEKLLRAMADAGGGNMYYVERPDQALGVFEEELTGLLTLSAQNVVLEIRPGSEVQLVAVHHRYPKRDSVHPGITLEVGDLYAREPKSILVEFFVPGLDRLGDVSIAQIAVSAHVLTDAGGIERQELTFPVVSPLSTSGHHEPEIRREMLLIESARAREEALHQRERGDITAAGRALRQAAGAIAAAPLTHVNSALHEIRTDMASLADRLEDETFDEADAKYLAQRAYNADRGRRSYEERLRRRKA
jgi:Ca-activated chloride channel family protein